MNIIKEKRKEQAKQHYALMKYQYKNEINFSIKNSKIYTDKSTFLKRANVFEDTLLLLSGMNSTEALAWIPSNGKAGLLNFASFKNPGGGFLKGALAQEEALCHDSTLYNVLENFTDFYAYNNKHFNKSMYLNRAIYSPSIFFPSQDKFIDIITCAAPNYKAGKEKGITKEQNSLYLKNRIKFILDIAQDNDIEYLILGAYGCGVFQQDPNEVASIILQLYKEYHFKALIFAIPDKDGYNHKSFKHQIKDFINSQQKYNTIVIDRDVVDGVMGVRI